VRVFRFSFVFLLVGSAVTRVSIGDEVAGGRSK